MKKENIHPTALIYDGVKLGKNVKIGAYAILYPNVVIGDNTSIGPYCIIGEPTASFYSEEEHSFQKTIIGCDSVIRSHTVIYEGSTFGKRLNTGHHVTIRENTIIGDYCSVGTLSDIQGKAEIGNYVRMHSNVHIGQLTKVKDYAWIFPYVVATNDMYPPMDRLKGCTIGEYALVTTGTILLPGVTVGDNALVAAGAVVSKDVNEEAVVMGVPAKERGNVRDVRDENGKQIYPWKEYLEENRGYPWQQK